MFNSVPFALFKNAGSIIPVDGKLVILSGQTFEIPEGSVKAYSSIRIDQGGTLRVTGNTGQWTEIGCSGNCIINGTIIARAGYDGQATHAGGTFSKTSAFGLGTLSYSITQRAGGAGGNGGRTRKYSYAVAPGGAQSLGRGGGGGGGADDRSNTGYYPGGNGGSGNGSGLSHGGNASGEIGGLGASNGGASANASAGAGGGGGYRGHHGKGLVLFVEGQILGTGSIHTGGRNGFNGGSGAAAPYANSGEGGGGGGGAGGSGGKLIVRYSSNSSSVLFNSNGGIGGAGGDGNEKNGWEGTDGGAGQNGDNGQVSIARIGAA